MASGHATIGGMATFFHHKLRVYQTALRFIVEIDAVVTRWPLERRYLVYQMRRAASSIALNIAEAAYEISPDDKRRIFRYARRSAGECVAVLDLAIEFRIMTHDETCPFYDQLDGIISMLTGLTRPK
jgi:four helix bundle protein